MKHKDRFKQFENYKQLKIPSELHGQIKTLAAEKGISIIQLIKDLIKNK